MDFNNNIKPAACSSGVRHSAVARWRMGKRLAHHKLPPRSGVGDSLSPREERPTENPHADSNQKLIPMNTISGKVIAKLPEVSGVGESSSWVRGGIVIDPITDGGKPLCIETFGEDKCAMVAQLSIGEVIIVDYRCESRFYTDRWFTTAKLVRIMRAQKMGGQDASE